MAKNDNVLGVDKIEIGAPGDGVMGLTLTEFTNVELNSLTFAGAESNEETIPTEAEDAYLTIGASATPTQVVFRLFEVFADDAVLLMGGSYDSMTAQYDAPISIPDVYLSIRITSKLIDGAQMAIELPYCRVSAKHDGNITKNGLLAVQVTATANTPVESGGTKHAPYQIRKI